MKGIRRKRSVLNIVVSLIVVLLSTAVASAAGSQVTSGDFQTFATGITRGYEISGRAQMVRTADSQTLVQVKALGLAPDTSYQVHVHNAPCSVNYGGGHYQDVIGGPANDTNEIWPGFTTNANGRGNGHAANDFNARPEAQSVVIHDTDGARIACANLQ
jgi:hypothetical protein